MALAYGVGLTRTGAVRSLAFGVGGDTSDARDVHCYCRLQAALRVPLGTQPCGCPLCL